MTLHPDTSREFPSRTLIVPTFTDMIPTYLRFTITFITLWITTLGSAQEMVLVVERCKALSQTSPINNIWVDDDNVKWVSNREGLFKVMAIDLVQKVSVPSGTTSLLTIRGGNADIQWNTAEMKALLGDAEISSASYDPKTKSLWIGTQTEGAFQVSVSPLKILQRFNTNNKKLTSNQINDIFIHNNGTIWIATNDGMLSGNGDKWTLQERYLNFVGVDAWGSNMWILGDDFLWQVDNKGKWTPIAIELKNVEGKLRDIAVDDKGRVWIASNMMTGFDVTANRYQRFGPGQYFTSQYVNCLDVDHDGSIWTGTDDKGLYLIQWEAAMTVNILMDTPPDCKSTQPTAALSVKITGGEAPFTYAWNSGQTTDKISHLASGNYVLTVTDSKGTVKTAEYDIPDASLTLSVEVLKPSSGAPTGDGSANLLINGGTGKLIYAWDNGETGQTAVKLTAGNHAVTVTDENGCSATTAFNLSEKVTPLTVTLAITTDNVCADTKAGVVEATVTGGKNPVKYQWSNGSITENKITGLGPGNYSVTVADAAGQTASAFISLSAPTPLSLSGETLGEANVGVENGQAQVKVAGGKSPYTYKWDNGTTTPLAKNLSAGTHAITVTDANGCTSFASFTVGENIATMGVIIRQVGIINCNGQATASLRTDITGGKGPYSYLWSSGQNTAQIEGLKAGTYTVTVTDVVGTKFMATATVAEPAPITVTATADAPASTNGSDGKASTKVSGGTGAYTYAWDNGEITSKVLKLNAGNHTVTVTDAAGCTATASVAIRENILGLEVTIEKMIAVKCVGGREASIKATVTGGKPPYAYAWSNNATTSTVTDLGDGLYTLTVTDAAGQSATSVTTIAAPQPLVVTVKADQPASANKQDGKATVAVTGGSGKYTYAWDSGELTPKALALGAGTHTITVTDENGCTAEGRINMTENILPLTVSIQQGEKILCAGQNNASLTAVIGGGKSPFTIKWKGPGKEWNENESLSQLGPGQYAIQVVDANGSSATNSYEIATPKPLEFSVEEIVPASTGNADGSVTLKAAGGTGTYTLTDHLWPSTASTHTITNLKPGNYSYVIKDSNGCSATVTANVTENILPLTVTIKQTGKVLCAGTPGATLETLVKGGKGPYTYAWSNAGSGATLSSVAEGTYTVNVSDATGLKGQAEWKVTGPEKLTAEATNLRAATNDRISDGKGNVEVKGGTPPYMYKWTSGETTAQATKLPLGAGTVEVTDANGCSAVADFVIKEKVLPELTATRLASGEPIRMEKIQFDADSTVIKPEAIPSLDELYEFLYDNPTIIIEVSGHTNSLPADDYCDRISTARAKSVADYLIGKGIEARRVISIGYGKRKPIATNQTPEGRKKNQRVEIRLIKIEE